MSDNIFMKKFSEDEVIIREGETYEEMYKIVSGRAALYLQYGTENEYLIGVLSDGKCFGEVSVLTGKPSPYSVVAISDIMVMRIGADRFESFISQNPRNTAEIMKNMANSIVMLKANVGMMSEELTEILNTLEKDKANKELAVTSLGSVFSVLGTLSLLGLGGGIWLLTNGIQSIKKVGRYEKYLKALGNKTYCELNRLAQAVGKSPKFVRKELKGMIDDGLFLEGHLDEEETGLITSNDSYVHYLETKPKQAVKKQEEVLETVRAQKEADTRKVSAQAQEVLDRGNEFIRQLRRCNDAIPGQEISEKISRMETLVGNIFDRVESHPEVVPELKKLMDYYLPMTVKLLNAYADMDAQSVQGENIQSSKREIEATLDTLNTAFEKLLDSIFKTTALDVSSDITVLQTLLAQEGLTEDEFTKLRKKSE